MIGMSYAAVPLYRLYCQVSITQMSSKLILRVDLSITVTCSSPQATGLGGAAIAGHDAEQVETMKPIRERVIKVTFNADTHASMQWNFRPQQSEIYVRFYVISYL